MLEVHKELTIADDGPRFDAFLEDVTAHLAPGWTRRREREAELARSLAGTSYVFRRGPYEGRPGVSVYFIRRHGRARVTNIVPEDVHHIGRAQYNAALDEFVDLNIQPLAEQHHVFIALTPDRLPITHWLNPEAADRLRRFSQLASKGTGSGHPLDFERWAEFLIQTHADETKLDPQTLGRWLIEEEGWPENMASDLATEFEFARNLLRIYDARQC